MTAPILLHNLGYPRIGARRELKRAVEAYWSGSLTRDALDTECRRLRAEHWDRQRDAGLDLIPTGDFSCYDQVADLALRLGVLPKRFAAAEGDDHLERLFFVARGRHSRKDVEDCPALEMSKWFDTNYHYLIPEIEPDTSFDLRADDLLAQIDEARERKLAIKPVVLGPVSFLLLAKSHQGGGNFQPLDRLDDLLPVYIDLLQKLAARGSEWIQIDEPILVTDLDDSARQAFATAYAAIHKALSSGSKARVLLATYFGALGDNRELVTTLPVDGLHIDLVRGADDLEPLLKAWPAERVLSLGVLDGRNIWSARLARQQATIEATHKRRSENLWLAPSCSLLHCPVSTEHETRLAEQQPTLHAVLAFADQKLIELTTLRDALDGKDEAQARIKANTAAWKTFDALPERTVKSVRDRVAALNDHDARRAAPYTERAAAQREAFRLPPFPTTTIGSFPQTTEIRTARRDWKAGRRSNAEYVGRMQQEIRRVIEFQDQTGIDVLVHGEPERNDMVEFFGELLDGYAFTQNGWVQSYGSRCVKPPIIFADVVRSRPLGTEWLAYAQSLTKTPVKGMLTGPVTMQQWAFVREDLSRGEIAEQIALALREEIDALVEAGIRIVQVDEPAFREGLPLRRSAHASYLDWAVRAFRLSTAHPDPSVQVHTHMCYSEFNDIIEAIAALDADVITIETARSNMEILEAFERFDYPNEVGPGVYDIHSPRVPAIEEMERLLDRAQRSLPADRLWVNPDCGLKTRQWPEVRDSLGAMAEAARRLRSRLEAAA